MTTPRGFGLNGQAFYTNVAKPTSVNLTFTVTPTNGLGVTSVKSNGYVNNVFMHTSTTPTANNDFTNPNPAVGFCIVQLKQNFNYFLGLGGVVLNPPNVTATKIDNSALSVGQVYVISTLGNATAAQWTTVGVPAGVTPAVGVVFTALATTAGTLNTSTSRVMLPSVTAVTGVEVVGTTNTMVPSNIATNAGQYVTLQFVAPTINTGAYVVPMIPTAPATGTVVSLSLLFDASSVTVDGL
jgi:hypothetical protein